MNEQKELLDRLDRLDKRLNLSFLKINNLDKRFDRVIYSLQKDKKSLNFPAVFGYTSAENRDCTVCDESVS